MGEGSLPCIYCKASAFDCPTQDASLQSCCVDCVMSGDGHGCGLQCPHGNDVFCATCTAMREPTAPAPVPLDEKGGEG